MDAGRTWSRTTHRREQAIWAFGPRRTAFHQPQVRCTKTEIIITLAVAARSDRDQMNCFGLVTKSKLGANQKPESATQCGINVCP